MSLWGDTTTGILASCVILAISIIINGRDIIKGCLDVLKSVRERKNTSVE
jgi:hypothetical protein